MSTAAASIDEIVKAFVGLKLSYRFSATVVRTPKVLLDCGDTQSAQLVRLLFSKPTQTSPCPPLTVFVDVDVVHRTATHVTYALFFEGQKYRRVLHLPVPGGTGPSASAPSAAPTGAAEEEEGTHVFNEALIDKVYHQKAAVGKRHLWESSSLPPAQVASTSSSEK